MQNTFSLVHMIAGNAKGGAEKFFTRLVKALHNRGIRQHVISRPEPEWEKLFTAESIAYSTARYPRFGKWATNRTIKRVIRETSPSVILTWMSRASMFCPPGPHKRVARLGGYYNLKYYQGFDHLIGNTQDICRYLAEMGWDRDKIHYLPNFVDIPDAHVPEPRENWKTPAEAPLLFALGRLHENKGFDTLIKAMAQVPEAYLWLAGSGPLQQELEGLITSLDLQERVKLLGWHHSPTPFFQAADVFICPSRHEPLGNVVLEGWAHKKPVIAAASQGPTQLIEHGVNGLLSPIDDVDAMAAAIRQAISHPKDSKNIAQKGFNSLMQAYSEEIVVAQYCNFFERIATS